MVTAIYEKLDSYLTFLNYTIDKKYHFLKENDDILF